MNKSLSNKIALLVVTGLFASLSARADLMFIEGGTSSDLAGYGDVGMTFQVNTAIMVTELSFYGLSLGGGDTPFAQLWNDDSNTQLGLVNWAAGEAVNGWNSKLLSTAVLLSPGVNYQIQAVAYWVPQYADDSGFTYAPEIDASSVTFKHDSGWGGWGVLPAPTSADLAAAPSLVNLTFTAVPEPATAFFLMGGLLGLRFVRPRKKA